MLYVVMFQSCFSHPWRQGASGSLLSRLASAAICACVNFKQRVNDSCQQQLWTWRGLTLV